MAPARDSSPAVGAVAQLGERLNRTQEADGSIPFSSTILLRFFSPQGVCKTIREQTFCIQAALSSPAFPPDSTVRTFLCRAPAPAPAFA